MDIKEEFAQEFDKAFRKPQFKTDRGFDLWLDLLMLQECLAGPLYGILINGNFDYVFEENESRFPGVVTVKDFRSWALHYVEEYREGVKAFEPANAAEAEDRTTLREQSDAMGRAAELAYQIQRERPARRNMKGAAATAIILESPAGQVLIQLRENRPEVSFANHWTLPGGKIEPGETPLEGARRELKEETGLEAPLAFWKAYERLGKDDLHIDQYVFTGVTETPLEGMILGEGAELRFITAKEIPGLALAYGFDALLEEYFVMKGNASGRA